MSVATKMIHFAFLIVDNGTNHVIAASTIPTSNLPQLFAKVIVVWSILSYSSFYQIQRKIKWFKDTHAINRKNAKYDKKSSYHQYLHNNDRQKVK